MHFRQDHCPGFRSDCQRPHSTYKGRIRALVVYSSGSSRATPALATPNIHVKGHSVPAKPYMGRRCFFHGKGSSDYALSQLLMCCLGGQTHSSYPSILHDFH